MSGVGASWPDGVSFTPVRCGKGRSHDREASPQRRSDAIRRAGPGCGSLALILWTAFAAPVSAAEPEGLRQLRLCASAGAEDPAAHCREALKAGLDQAHAATANALLGFYVEPEPEDELFDRAEKAEASYRAALASSPDAALAAFRLGRFLEGRGKAAEALRWLDQAVARRPDWPAAHLVRARALRALRRDEEAVRALEDAAAADPGRAAEALMTAVEIEEARGRDAAQLVRRAAAANPKDLRLSLELGRRLSNSGQKAEASALLMKAFAERQQGNGQLLAGLSSWLRSEGHDAKALQTAREAAAAEPDVPYVLGELASALRENGDLDEALQVFRHWRDVAPRDEMAVREEGLALADAGRLTEAIKVFRVYYDEFPDRRQDAARFLGRALALSGRRREAIPLLEEGGLAEEAAAIERELSARPLPPDEP